MRRRRVPRQGREAACADDQDVGGHARQLRDLALENRSPVDDERALVPPAETGGPAAGENRSTIHGLLDLIVGMGEAGIGRVLVASLHQSIADLLPTRLTFYENWLNAEGLREGTIGLAPLYAVLSFLRQEGDAYDMITTRAGEYAAEWTVQSMPPYPAGGHEGRARLASQPDAAAAGARARAEQLQRQPRHFPRARRPDEPRRARLDFLYGAGSRYRSRCAASMQPRSRGF